jgi:hypothetical protein
MYRAIISAMSHEFDEKKKRPTDLVHHHIVCKVKFAMSGCRRWGGNDLKLMANFGQKPLPHP